MCVAKVIDLTLEYKMSNGKGYGSAQDFMFTLKYPSYSFKVFQKDFLFHYLSFQSEINAIINILLISLKAGTKASVDRQHVLFKSPQGGLI